MPYYDRNTSRIRGVQPETQAAARRLRAGETPAEEILWQALRGRQVAGIKFRRQHPVGRFILDFYASSCHLVVELDGDSHKGKEEYDEARTQVLNAHGYRVLRFRNEEVLEDLGRVLKRIAEAALTPGPSPKNGRGES